MGALVQACQKTITVKNTGSECNESMGPTAMLFAVPPGTKWNTTDMADFTAYLRTQIHAAKASRIYPLFGPSIPIRKITLNKESDVIATMDDGTPIFIRYGILTRIFGTTEGGICYMEAMQSFTKAGFSFIEVDNAGQILFRQNTDGTFSGLKTTFVYSPSPDLADFKNPTLSYFQVSFTPDEYVRNGIIYQSDSTLLDLLGLLDSQVTDATGSTTTILKVGVKTICGQTDLVAKLGAPLAVTGNFVVKRKSTGAVTALTGAAIVSGHIELTGTFLTGQVYTVELAAPSVLLANSIPGYEGVVTVEITIP